LVHHDHPPGLNDSEEQKDQNRRHDGEFDDRRPSAFVSST
jgi:hypothetical protein